MSIIYPRDLATAGDPLDADAVTRTLQDFADEVDANIGEQNVAAGGFTSLADDMEVDAVLRLNHYIGHVNWTSLNADFEPAANPVACIRVPMVLYWSSLITIGPLTTCRGGTYNIVASFQLDAGTTSNDADYWKQLVGCCFAFRIDGTVYEETQPGGVERSNDAKGEGIGWDIGTYIMELAVELPPGVHTIELVGRPARAGAVSGTADTGSWAATSFYEIFNHEMWAEEAI